MFPQGSKDPKNRELGPKYYSINGIWDLKPYYLGPWTLRVYSDVERPTNEATLHFVLVSTPTRQQQKSVVVSRCSIHELDAGITITQ